MWKSLTIYLVSVVGAFALLSGADPPTIKDLYLCSGANKKGPYQGLVLMTKPEGGGYILSWGKFFEGRYVESQMGVGIEHDAYFAVALVENANRTVSVASYKIGVDRLEGMWAGEGGTIYPEVCLADTKVALR